jgi:hypothetical protein
VSQLSVTIDVSHVPGNAGPESGWEGTMVVYKGERVDGGTMDFQPVTDDPPPGYEAGDVAVLLARMAADLRTIREREN